MNLLPYSIKMNIGQLQHNYHLIFKTKKAEILFLPFYLKYKIRIFYTIDEQIAPFTICAKLSAVKLAPPTNAPSISD